MTTSQINWVNEQIYKLQHLGKGIRRSLRPIKHIKRQIKKSKKIIKNNLFT